MQDADAKGIVSVVWRHGRRIVSMNAGCELGRHTMCRVAYWCENCLASDSVSISRWSVVYLYTFFHRNANQLLGVR